MLWKKGTVEEILIGRGIFEANDDWLKIYYNINKNKIKLFIINRLKETSENKA